MVQVLISPQRFEEMMRQVCLTGRQRLQPLRERRQNRLATTFGQGALRLQARPLLGRFQFIQQLPDGRIDQAGNGYQGSVFTNDAPNPAPTVIAAWVAEIDLVVLNDLLIEIGDIHRSVRPHLDVDRAKLAVLRHHERRQLLWPDSVARHPPARNDRLDGTGNLRSADCPASHPENAGR